MKVIIIGGVAGGASAAARLRRLDEQCEIVMFERGRHVSYANCGIPYYCGDVIKDKEKLLLMTPEKLKALVNVDVRIESEVTAIDRDRKSVTVVDHRDNSHYEESFDKLILSPGAAPLRPPIPGIDDGRIFTVRNVDDGIKIKLSARPGARAVVVGGGFIGLEMAENLVHRGLNVSIVELSEQVMAPLDREMAAQVHQQIRDQGISLYLRDGVQSFNAGKTLTVVLSSGTQIETDIVILAIGVRPETGLAVACGLSIGTSGGILVDEHLQTSDPDIYALGDAIEITDAVSAQKMLIPLAGPANKQGRIVAENLAGMTSCYEHTLGTSIAKVFDLSVATTGSNEKQLKRQGIEYQRAYSLGWSHAEYYPGPFAMSIKLLFSPSNGRILGAQIIGIEGVDKRIDAIATAISFSGTTKDLMGLELAYAPPYGLSKDPVNVIGMIAENIRGGKMKPIYWNEINPTDKNVLFLDVRSALEFSLGGGIANATNIPLEELRSRLNEIPKTKKIIAYCAKGQKGYFASRILQQMGFDNVFNLIGGLSILNPMLNDDKAIASGIAPAVERSGNRADIQEKSEITLTIDACGLQCPGPIMKLAEAAAGVSDGATIEVTTTDPGFKSDIAAWCRSTRNTLVDIKTAQGIITALIRKGSSIPETVATRSTSQGNGKTLVVFSNDLDKAIASFIIANGAAATGKPVTMFFTFWGLSVLRKAESPAVSKDLLAKMFGWMLPKGTAELSLSKMHMSGLGTLMMKYVMKQKNVSTLPELIEQAKKQGVRLIACQMSMDVMGLTHEELLDGVEIGGVASYIDSAEQADMNLFI